MAKEKWNKLYKNYIQKEYQDFDNYFKVKIKLKKKFYQEVIKYANNKPVLECGCGTGKGCVYLALEGLQSFGMDKEKEMVEETKKLSKKMTPNNPVTAILGDIKSIPYADNYFSVTHSSGVFEHFSDEEIINLINEQLRVSDICIFSVPTKYFEKPMLGNERFMTRNEWREIISKSDALIIKEFGYHYKTLGKRIMDILKKPRYLFKPIALYGFVLKKNK